MAHAALSPKLGAYKGFPVVLIARPRENDRALSAKTVEMYLSNAYRKLGIRSRSRLADRLRDA